jgi:hypothetical protein
LNGYQWEIITYLCDINGGFIQYSAGISIAKSIIMSLQFQTESLAYRGGNLREIITYRCDISGGFIQYLTGISIRGIIVWNQ